jgi:hypothetical protein
MVATTAAVVLVVAVLVVAAVASRGLVVGCGLAGSQDVVGELFH